MIQSEVKSIQVKISHVFVLSLLEVLNEVLLLRCYGSFHLTAAAIIMSANQLFALIEFALYSPIVQGQLYQNTYNTQKHEAI